MCGLVGFASTERFKEKLRRAEILEEALVLDSFRGWESTGLALIEEGKEKARPQVYKRALTGSDYIQTQFFHNQFIKRIEDYSIAIGHNRSATRGTVVDKNAHPFQHGEITLVHNGTIDNINLLLPFADTPKDMDVDSEKLTYLMASDGEQKVLEKISGAYALVWHNAKDGTLNFARNDRKPLNFCFVKDENTMFWASEYTLLLHLLERRGIKMDIIDGAKMWFPPIHNIVTFDVKNLREYSVRPFVPSQLSGPPGKQSGTTGSRGTRATGSDTDTGMMTEHLPPWVEDIRTLADTDKSPIAESIRESLKRNKGTGRPTKPRKLARVKADLRREFNYEYDQAVIVDPLIWIPYKNQKELGCMIGRTKQGVPCCMYQVKTEDFGAYHKLGRVIGQVVNITTVQDDKKAIIIVEHPRHQELAKRMIARRNLPLDNDDTVRRFKGPSNQLVTEGRFRELADIGCGGCGGYINSRDHSELIWHGEPPAAICPECQNNVSVMASLGLEVRGYQPQRVH